MNSTIQFSREEILFKYKSTIFFEKYDKRISNAFVIACEKCKLQNARIYAKNCKHMYTKDNTQSLHGCVHLSCLKISERKCWLQHELPATVVLIHLVPYFGSKA